MMQEEPEWASMPRAQRQFVVFLSSPMMTSCTFADVHGDRVLDCCSILATVTTCTNRNFPAFAAADGQTAETPKSRKGYRAGRSGHRHTLIYCIVEETFRDGRPSTQLLSLEVPLLRPPPTCIFKTLSSHLMCKSHRLAPPRHLHVLTHSSRDCIMMQV
jgi:hypothetical protein